MGTLFAIFPKVTFEFLPLPLHVREVLISYLDYSDQCFHFSLSCFIIGHYLFHLQFRVKYILIFNLTTFSPTVPTSAAGISHVLADVEAPGGEKWERLKSGGKEWQATPKNLPRMQRTRAIPVA